MKIKITGKTDNGMSFTHEHVLSADEFAIIDHFLSNDREFFKRQENKLAQADELLKASSEYLTDYHDGNEIYGQGVYNTIKQIEEYLIEK